MWKQDAVEVIPIVISATGIIPKSLTLPKFKETYPAPKHIYTNAKSGNSWHMLNCKKFPKLHIRPLSLILLMIHPRIGEYFPAKSEK
jgi:hypothetical protein